MSKLATLLAALSALHPNANAPASPNQTRTTPLGAKTMTKMFSIAAALVFFVPVAAVLLYASALMVA